MKKLILGIILALVMVIPFITKVANTADSAQDWILGIVIIVVILVFAGWLLTRQDRSETGSGTVTSAGSPPPLTGASDFRSEVSPAHRAAPSICGACGAESQGPMFCGECGKPLQQRIACPQCGSPYPSGVKFCPDCGHKRS